MKRLLSRFDTRTQIVLMALLALYFLVWPVWRAQFPIEIVDNEGFNAYHADAAVSGGPLYPSPGTLIVNNYPPLSFYALGWLGKGFGAPLCAGRAGAAFSGFWFVATMARSYNRYVGMNDPQLAAQLIMVAALSWFLSRE